MNRAIFLDRDGVIIREKEYLKDWKQVELIDDVGRALRRAQNKGYLLFIVSNQSGVGRGLITPDESLACFQRTFDLLSQDGVKITETYVAPEAPDQPSIGRKPSPHFVLEAMKKFDVDPAQSHGVGDRLTDLQCWKNAGLKSAFLVMTGYGQKNLKDCTLAMPDLIAVADLTRAVAMILDEP